MNVQILTEQPIPPKFSLAGFDLQPMLNAIISFGITIIICILIFIVGWFIIKHISKFTHKAFQRSKIEPSAATFLESFISIALKALLILTIVIQLGVPGTSIVALLGTVGLAIGMALQGSLSNFAGGILILILKPFRIGDFIETQGSTGTVEKIQIFNTWIKTVDNKVIIMPNGPLANAIVTNYSAKGQRRVDITISVGYESDINKVKELLMDMLMAHPKVLKNPEPFVRLSKQSSSSLDFVTRSWVNATDYWDVYFDLMEESKKILDHAGIEIPYNKLDVNVIEYKK